MVRWAARGGSRRRRGALAALGLGVCLATVVPGAALAAFPGKNGSIAFQSDQAGNLDIWVMDPNGGGARNLTADSAAADTEPAWSPDGRRIVFRSERVDPDGDIFVMDADGSRPRNLTADWPHRVREGAFTPDGRQVVFGASNGSAENLFVVDAAGGPIRPLTSLTSSAHTVTDVAVAPDGRLVGFSSTCPLCGTSNAWMLPFPDTRGSDPRAGEVGPFPFFSESEGRFFDDFSPDGSRVLFSVRKGVYEIHVTATASASHGPFASLTPGAPTHSYSAAFSPDGRQIAFRRDAPGPCCNQAGDIWVMGGDGSNPRNLTASPAAESAPAWQPLPLRPAVGRLRRNPRRGTGTLVVRVPGPGRVVLRGKGLKRTARITKRAGSVRLPVKPAGSLKRRLAARGRATVRVVVAYTRPAGITTTRSKRLQLIRR